ncbi:cuticle collagen 2C-like [Neopelma chrysocephalum]|uniref:cuticle collagen 2C-like n=1 Tax=Neopelma chrysocephalum TaxID=114329 RepID=UPI000FCCE6FD|nr:cuticle collagen 2C-like [Neopelma chrysocephalum]
MDPRPGQPPEPLLTVNEQVIVMSGHETIRVLEVGVDTPLPAQGDPKTAAEGAGGAPGQGGPSGGEDGPPSTPNSAGGEAAGQPKAAPASPPPVPPPGAAPRDPAGPAGPPAVLQVRWPGRCQPSPRWW